MSTGMRCGVPEGIFKRALEARYKIGLDAVRATITRYATGESHFLKDVPANRLEDCIAEIERAAGITPKENPPVNTVNEETGPGLEPATVETYKPIEGVKIGKFKEHPAYQGDAAYLAEIRAALTPGPITDRIMECHEAAWRAKWWHDRKTLQPIERNRAEMMLLQCSELGEAADGLESDLMDDKLPHRRMVEVEIADFNIRLFDYCGGLKLDLQAAVTWSEANEPMTEVILLGGTAGPALWIACRHIFRAMEADRKARTAEHLQCLARAYRAIEWYALVARDMDVEGARIEKMAYNKVRKDHSIEARTTEGGKAY